MAMWGRRSVLATCAALSTTGALTSIGSTAAEDDGSSSSSAGEFSDGWSSYRAGPGNTGYLPIDGEFEEPDTVAWEYEADGPLAVVDGTVYLNDGEEIHALDDDGSVEWTTAVAGAGGTPAVAGGTVYVGGDRLTALEADSGEIEWTADLAATSPTVAYGRVLTAVDGTVYALEPDGGAVDWERETVEIETDDESGPVEHAVSSIVASDGLVFAKTTSTESDVTGIAAFDPETGATAWTWSPAEDPDAPYERLGELAARDGKVYAVVPVTDGGEGMILDAETGDPIRGGTSLLTPAVGDGVWISTSDTGFSAQEPAGEGLWSVRGATFQYSSASIVEETVVVIKAGRGHDSSTELVGFDAETGDERWSVELEDDDRATVETYDVPVLGEDTVYVRSRRSGSDDVLVALRPSDEDESDDDPVKDDPDDDESPQEDGSKDDPCCEDEDGNDDSNTGDGSDDSNAGEGNDSETGNGGESDEDDGVGRNGDDTDDGSNEPDDTGSADDEPEPGEDDDATPGFTTGAGIVGGALGLEWLRRKAGVNESTGVDDPAE
ncbi:MULTISPECIES: outer membrane protein assembly factor BamB family protein [Natrialbaceae]|uniref:outer membrane protein assembly factor BamB family protein n=1 Tax=Natrialbaceae TaxID=1644061 RepID=UPI00207D6ADC|nr:PQQ-binding-like beta-propeller repeat protein [Natronococcus sp. CG52]